MTTPTTITTSMTTTTMMTGVVVAPSFGGILVVGIVAVEEKTQHGIPHK